MRWHGLVRISVRPFKMELGHCCDCDGERCLQMRSLQLQGLCQPHPFFLCFNRLLTHCLFHARTCCCSSSYPPTLQLFDARTVSRNRCQYAEPSQGPLCFRSKTDPSNVVQTSSNTCCGLGSLPLPTSWAIEVFASFVTLRGVNILPDPYGQRSRFHLNRH